MLFGMRAQWLVDRGLWPWTVMGWCVLTALGFVGNLSALREERARRASLGDDEHELSVYQVRSAEASRAGSPRQTSVLRTTTQAVEIWHGRERRWRRPWVELAFSRAEADRRLEVLVIEAAPPASSRPLRLGLAGRGCVTELLLAARRKGATVRDET
ncbi:hypothetical protein [Streptomyces sp. NPDC048462]|uniref:hypothetical protein n=1 Tax=Streptomyces sp. NPDC048462 TaxID=3365555 RepID=UPI00371984DE